MKLNVLLGIFLVATVNCSINYCNFHRMHLFCGGIKDFSPSCGGRRSFYFKKFSEADKLNVVRKHNEYRNLVAQGNAFVGPQYRDQMPPAANMLEMRWDDELAQLSQEYVKQCSFVAGSSGHTCAGIKGDPQPVLSHLACLRLERYDSIGESLFFQQHYQPPGSKDYTPDAITSWFERERRYFSLKTIDYYADPNEFGAMSLEFGHLAQIIWHDTELVGCATIDYQDGYGTNSLVACHYASKGNTETHKVYEKGAPCSRCPGGQTCSTTYPALCDKSRFYYFYDL